MPIRRAGGVAESELQMETDARSFRKLEAWQRGMELTLAVYALAEKLPAAERFGQCGQMRRAARSVPANIAEGHERRGRGYLYHLAIALGSLAELDTDIEIALRLRYITASDAAAVLSELARVRQLLHGLRRSIRLRIAAEAASATVAILAVAIALSLM